MDPTTLVKNTHDIDHKRPAAGASMQRRRVFPFITAALMAIALSLGAASTASADTGPNAAGDETNLGALVGLGI
ncbi:hypothetical protein ACIRPT_26555 [Streptomyces sp. NPDC101227]|uniref:hypothetical protein n=1 Tax=Streptomyces sp. NPDC101227 TaxID=3366136 RepID=UPI0037F9BA8C